MFQTSLESHHPKALLVYVHRASPDKERFEKAELEALLEAAEFKCVHSERVDLRDPHPKYLIGSGTLARIESLVETHQAEIVVFGVDLSSMQERNLERSLKRTIFDRTALLLHLFALRAQSDTGRLQVEQAKQAHLASRLTRAWTHLERQKGGIGMRSGAGEKQIEMDRRLIKKRCARLTERLKSCTQQRRRARSLRQANATPTVALLGYTNAGKSSLFNALTHTSGLAPVSNQLFATLDPLIRQMHLPDSLVPALLIDTVGFIDQLPEVLLEAFSATLEESLSADLLIHVIDASDPNRQRKKLAVEQLLVQLQAEDIPSLVVWNKIDSTLEKPEIGVCVSAKEAVGLEALKEKIARLLNLEKLWVTVRFIPTQSELVGMCYKLFSVKQHTCDPSGEQILVLQVDGWRWNRFLRFYPEVASGQSMLSSDEVKAFYQYD